VKCTLIVITHLVLFTLLSEPSRAQDGAQDNAQKSAQKPSDEPVFAITPNTIRIQAMDSPKKGSWVVMPGFSELDGRQQVSGRQRRDRSKAWIGPSVIGCSRPADRAAHWVRRTYLPMLFLGRKADRVHCKAANDGVSLSVIPVTDIIVFSRSTFNGSGTMA
jgi:hypothetical protein